MGKGLRGKRKRHQNIGLDFIAFHGFLITAQIDSNIKNTLLWTFAPSHDMSLFPLAPAPSPKASSHPISPVESGWQRTPSHPPRYKITPSQASSLLGAARCTSPRLDPSSLFSSVWSCVASLPAVMLTLISTHSARISCCKAVGQLGYLTVYLPLSV